MGSKKKKTFTYATYADRKRRAARKAKEEGMTLSERIDKFLEEYVADQRLTDLQIQEYKKSIGL